MNKNNRVQYTDEQKISYWSEKIEELELKIRIIRLRIEHLKSKKPASKAG